MTFEQRREQLESEIQSLEENLELYTDVFSLYAKLGADDPGYAETQKKLRQKKAELTRLYEKVNSSWYRSWRDCRDIFLFPLWITVVFATLVIFLDIATTIPIFENHLPLLILMDALAIACLIWLSKTPF